jgi:hypothetical protein
VQFICASNDIRGDGAAGKSPGRGIAQKSMDSGLNVHGTAHMPDVAIFSFSIDMGASGPFLH